ncbi:GxxExxY protein [Thiorhodococcus minor]|uniref:GxxExxY protein n=1 Tax=Thiorhodococcus minor TaxID=57489 RepID=A0A6M0K1Z8_9GAMM|nr:GxxExxY protein [Thiorhodococcus minor]NEV63782.1 GxxExxY protein [Thiorhodococcus minor]
MNSRNEPNREIEELAHATIGAAIEVHRYLGPGFLESVYEAALAVELQGRGIEYQRQLGVAVEYKGVLVGEGKLDLLVGRSLIVELKAVDALLPIHKAQLLSYLKTLRHPLGLLINFKVQVLRQGIQRVILSN